MSNRPKNLVVAATTNGGSGGTGIVATAFSLETGAKQWQFGYTYPTPPRGISADTNVPSTGLPGGATAADLVGAGYTTDFVMGDLYGNLWRLDAAMGTSKTGTGTPLFQFSTNKHPIGALPAVYSSAGVQHAVFASGGYADPISANWAAGTQSLISIPINATGPYPIHESSSKLAIKQDLGTSERGYAQVLVVGNELFLATDTTDVNSSSYGGGTSTGRVTRYDLATKATSTVVVRGGASSLASSETRVYASSSDKQQQLSADANSTVGASVDTLVASKTSRLMWLRTL